LGAFICSDRRSTERTRFIRASFPSRLRDLAF
jgi:hypothetical protein